MKGACWHKSPDGRRFVTFTEKCICAGLGPCWRAKCECGELLAEHNYGPDTAKRDALVALRTVAAHASCSASRQPEAVA